MANKALVINRDMGDQAQSTRTAVAFWERVADQFPEWRDVQGGRMTAGDVRRDFIHSHGVVLQSLGHLGNVLFDQAPKGWQNKLSGLRNLDWSRTNATTWEGRAIVGGQVSKSRQNVILMTNILKQTLDLPLSPEEQKAETAFLRSEHG